MESPIILSVCVITYNHEAFIRQALDSVLMQKVDFSWEIIVADDCSTDQTKKILAEYKANYPQLINLLIREVNVGPALNWLGLMKAAKGKYIAYLEGDDHWTDTEKLATQVKFLEENPDYAISFHKVNVEFDSDAENFYTDINLETKSTTDIYDLALKNYIHSPSVVVRNVLKGYFPDWFKTAYPGDWPFYILTAEFGKIRMHEKVMAVYRIHDAGMHGKKSDISLSPKVLPLQKTLADYFYNRNKRLYRIFKNRYVRTYAYNVGIMNLDKLTRSMRIGILLNAGIQLGSPIYWIRAMIIGIAPNYYIKKQIE